MADQKIPLLLKNSLTSARGLFSTGRNTEAVLASGNGMLNSDNSEFQ